MRFLNQIKIITVALGLAMSAVSYATVVTVVNGTKETIKIGISDSVGGKYFEVTLQPYKWSTSIPFKYESAGTVKITNWYDCKKNCPTVETTQPNCELIFMPGDERSAPSRKNHCS